MRKLLDQSNCTPGLPLFLLRQQKSCSLGMGVGAEKIACAQKNYQQSVSIVLWLKEYFKGFFFPNRILRNALHLFMYIVHNGHSAQPEAPG